MSKTLFALPFVALALAAAAPPAAAPKISLNPPAEIAADPANRLNIELSTGGTVVIQLRPDVAPNHVRRIQQLATSGFYNGTIFHRVIPGFMAQGGDPTGTGEGDSPLPDLAPEFNDLPHLRGVMSMARTQDPNSANSQFFIMLAPTFSLDHDYTGFGRVVAGMQFVDQIAPGEPPAQPTRIVRAWLDGTPAAAVAEAPAPAPAAAPVEAPPAPAEAAATGG
jgi:cyclophilin family peptidyl-prolyl cis-trans isomerase